MSDKVTIIKKDGREFQVPRTSIHTYKRMLGDKIARIVTNPEMVAPSVQPVKQVIKPSVNNDTADNKKVDSDKNERYGEGNPSNQWNKPQLQNFIDDKLPGVAYQAQDTKAQLLAYIKAANKAN